MAGNDVSIKFAVDGESKFKTAVAGINSQIKNLNSQLNLSMSTMSGSADRMAILSNKSDALKQKVSTLSAQYDKAKGDLDKYVRELQILQNTEGASEKEISRANDAVMRQTKVVNDVGTALNKAKIDVNECADEMKRLGEESDKATSKLGKIGSTASTVAEKTATLSRAAAGLLAGVVALGAKSVQAYADYEQLAGGVQTLFGDSAKIVEENANKAFKTAGLSANEYMETVTSFSASLLQSLGGNTAKAAEIADMALIDMADNANKMGTSMESIQNAYQGFAKQNYTMLDNLKLGYGGTKTEMERLLKDAEKLTGVKYNISNLSDVYNAIHAIQTELGITGTTAKEAESTISGSINSLKASFNNLLAGVAKDGADMEKLVTDFVDSLKIAGGNIWEVLKQIFDNLPAMAKIVIVIAAVTAVLSPVAGLIASITTTLQALIVLFPGLTAGLTAAKTAMVGLNLAFLANPVVLITAGIVALIAVLVGLYHESEKFRAFVDGLFPKVKEVVTGAIGYVKEAIESIKELPDKAKQWGQDMIDNFVQGIKDKVQTVKDAVKDVANTVKDFLGFSEPKKGPLSNFHTFAPDMIDLWTEGVNDNLGKVKNASANMASAAANVTATPMSAQNTAVNALGSALNGMVANKSQPIELTLNIDGKQFARATYNSLQAEGIRQGGRLTTV